MEFKNGKVKHKKKIVRSDGEIVQTDSLTTTIPLDAIDEDGVSLLDYWWVEEFDRAYIDWKNYQIVLDYKTTHYLNECDVDSDEIEDE